ncbi:ABC transporter permease [Prevotella amnii]|jgi:ABC-2 type transporter|uniref:ABC transporter permease n=10 Tax=Prevotellaceae TaxID=171552 RepID=A0A5C8GKJ7_9BACT|nr:MULTISPECIES: ABC transporter permease [Prevotellaceae]KGF43487.1 ABC transporter [Prevotella bivia DNF00320]KGF50910.1 ABC transporter [Prevotella amnii DNF00058]MBF1084421.1 ABC transporter permease [Solobacterium sp.]OFP41523.1 ABC transporter [Prevotella sp. HMSC069G02]ANR73745.1 ABC transporter [Prevotella scopos JCM 17725]
MKVLIASIYYQLLSSMRIKQAVFFTVIFPAFIFLIFSSIWGINNKEYCVFLLTGICAMTIASDGLFAIGGVIKQYYTSGVMKFIKVMPYNIITHIISLVFSRMIYILFSFVILFILGRAIFGVTLNVPQYLSILSGSILGLIEFSFLGLLLSFTNMKAESEKGLINIIYFGLIFLSDTFYPMTEINPVFEGIVEFSPITPVLKVLRGDYTYTLYLALWAAAFMIAFYFCFKRFQVKRSKQ